MQISAVIICLNEEKNIWRCLSSLEGVADEIIIADSGSTDRTREIAEQFNVRFEQLNWEGYASTKNAANALANCEYILSLDADEALSAELKDSILALKESIAGKAYSFNRLNNYCGTWIKFAGWYPDRKIRLFPKERAKWVGDFVHETLSLDLSTQIEHVNGDLLHYSYYTIEEHIEREKKYAKLAATADAEQGKSPSKLKAYLKAGFKFLHMYVIRLGFLHGAIGFRLCKTAALGKVWRNEFLMHAIRS